VHVREEVDLVVVDRLMELPVLVGVFGVHTDNHIWDLGVVADVPAHTPGALQDEASVSPGLVLRHQDDGLLEVVLGVGSGSGLVELRRKFALYWTRPWQINCQLNELMYEITPHHSWARQGSEAVLIDRLKPFHAMYLDALEHHCPPDPKADLTMLVDEFAEFIDSNLDEEIDAGLPASNSCRLASYRLRPQAQQPPPLSHCPLGSWNMQHIWCHL
jgi:hypothetical protein